MLLHESLLRWVKTALLIVAFSLVAVATALEKTPGHGYLVYVAGLVLACYATTRTLSMFEWSAEMRGDVRLTSEGAVAAERLTKVIFGVVAFAVGSWHQLRAGALDVNQVYGSLFLGFGGPIIAFASGATEPYTRVAFEPPWNKVQIAVGLVSNAAFFYGAYRLVQGETVYLWRDVPIGASRENLPLGWMFVLVSFGLFWLRLWMVSRAVPVSYDRNDDSQVD